MFVLSAYKIAVICMVCAEIILVPLFIKAQWPKKTKKSLALKMICASLFVAIAVTGMVGGQNYSLYAILMVVGFIMCWFGDLFLHVSPKQIYFFIGLIFFLIGHIFFASAYTIAVKDMFPEASFFDWREMIAIVALLIIGVVGRRLTMSHKLGKATVPVLIYTVALLTMFVKASSLGIRYAMAGMPYAIGVCLLLCIGGALFVISDSTLVYINFDKRKKLPLKAVNLVTYFGAQVMLACSLLFIH